MKKAIAALLLVLVPCLLYMYTSKGRDGSPYRAITNSAGATTVNARIKGVRIDAGPRIDYNLLDIQSIDVDVRVAVGTGNVVGHRPIFYKTTDGGSTWTAKSLPFGWHPRFIAFRNHDEGLITTHDVTGCPSACQHRNIVLKTVDGGENWRLMEYADHRGVIVQIEFDSQGNGYGLLYLSRSGNAPTMPPVTATILESTDFGETWSLFYEIEDPTHSLPMFLLRDDLLIVPTGSGKIVELDEIGNEVAEHETGYQHFQSVAAAGDGAVFALVYTDNDGFLIRARKLGDPWEVVRTDPGLIVSARSADDVTILQFNPASLPITDVTPFVGSVSVSRDGGASWSESEWVHSLMPRRIHSFGSQLDTLLLDDRILSIEYQP